MVSITYTSLTTLVDASLAVATAEAIIDNAINELNLYGDGVDLPNMTGTSGSKTLSVESKEAGAILKVAKAIYFRDYKGPTQVTLGGVSMNTQRVEDVVKECAQRLKEIEVSYG